jgi:hypothetical protein
MDICATSSEMDDPADAAIGVRSELVIVELLEKLTVARCPSARYSPLGTAFPAELPVVKKFTPQRSRQERSRPVLRPGARPRDS